MGAEEPLKVMIRTGQATESLKERSSIVEVALCKERKQESLSSVVRDTLQMFRFNLRRKLVVIMLLMKCFLFS